MLTLAYFSRTPSPRNYITGGNSFFFRIDDDLDSEARAESADKTLQYTSPTIYYYTYQWRAGVIRYLGARRRRGFRVDVIIAVVSGRRRGCHVTGGVGRHVAAAPVLVLVTSDGHSVRFAASTTSYRIPHAPDGRVRAVGAGHRGDTD